MPYSPKFSLGLFAVGLQQPLFYLALIFIPSNILVHAMNEGNIFAICKNLLKKCNSSKVFSEN